MAGQLYPAGLRLPAGDPVVLAQPARFAPAGRPPKPTGFVKAIAAFAHDGIIVQAGEERSVDDPLVRAHRGMFVDATDSEQADAAAMTAAVARRQAAVEAEGAQRERHAEATVAEEKAREARATAERRRRPAADARRREQQVAERQAETREEALADIAAGRALVATPSGRWRPARPADRERDGAA